jgi:glutamate-1-semialdehyde 2,1-aminomutase
MAPGGAQAHYGVTPDLATFGKAVAAGLPLSVIAGRRDIMEQMFGGGVAFGGTFNGNPLSLAGANAALAELAKDDGAALARANSTGKKLMDGVCSLGRKHGVPLTVTGFGAAFNTHFTARNELTHYRDTLDDDRDRLRRYLGAALEEGLHIVPDGRCYVSAVHTDQDVAETLDAADRALSAIAAKA